MLPSVIGGLATIRPTIWGVPHAREDHRGDRQNGDRNGQFNGEPPNLAT